MKKQRNEKPIDEELLMRMMAGEAAGTGEPGTGKGETAVPVEKAQEGKAADTRRRKGRQADYETTFLKGMDIPARYGEIPLDEDVYVICRSGGRSARATAYLNQQGWDTVNVAGGMGSWARAGRPLEADGDAAPEVI